jgi:hypothetical protein
MVGLIFQTDLFCTEFAGNFSCWGLRVDLVRQNLRANFLGYSPLYMNSANFSAKNSPFV